MDVTGYVSALRHPELKVPRQGPLRYIFPHKVYRGRVLSHVEWIPFEQRFREVYKRQEAGEDVELDIHEIVGDYFDAIGIPQKVVFSLPTNAVVAVMKDFWALQTQTMSGPKDSKSMNGSSLPAKAKSPRLEARREKTRRAGQK